MILLRWMAPCSVLSRVQHKASTPPASSPTSSATCSSPSSRALMPEHRERAAALVRALQEAPRHERERGRALAHDAHAQRLLSVHPRSRAPGTAPEYEQRFAAVQEKIRAGDIYQLNLTFKARFRLEGSPLTFYRDLRQRQRVAYGGIVDTGEVTVLSASPELFIEKDGRVIETRPMKGTAPRAGTPEADSEARRVLSSDTKQRAENLMIVDLMRNDLGRIAEIGSVSVTDLFTVETFRTLHQMTSGVRATLEEGIGWSELMRAIFPPGSVIGAPKIRAMELIREYETEPRGVYCGAIGHIAPDGRALFNVAIRTPVDFPRRARRDGHRLGRCLRLRRRQGICGVSAEDEVPHRPAENVRTHRDAAAREGRTATGCSRDTLRASRPRRNISASPSTAPRFWPPSEREVDGRRGERLRVRLLLAEDGKITVTSTPLGPHEPSQVMRFAVSGTRLDSADPFLFHKTTRRELYDREWKHYNDTQGADEVIYLNENGDLAEGSRTNIFIEKNGRLLTPPLTAGLLPGVLRHELIAAGEASEHTLTLDDLETADAVLLGNSVRGLVRAEPIAP